MILYAFRRKESDSFHKCYLFHKLTEDCIFDKMILIHSGPCGVCSSPDMGNARDGRLASDVGLAKNERE